MKRILKRAMAVMLTAVMLLTAAPLSGFIIESSAAGYSVGDRLYFGSYPQYEVTDDYLKARLAEQDYDSQGRLTYNGNEYLRTSYSDSGSIYFMAFAPIEWRVLSVDIDGIYVMAEKVLDANYYNLTEIDVTWADCTLRTWLNGYFYNLAFSDSEKQKINTTRLVNGDNPYYGTEGGIDTYDKVWIPSIADVTNPASGFTSDYGKSDTRVAHNLNSNAVWSWWLRTPGKSSQQVCYVGTDGSIKITGYDITNVSDIRPALKLSLTNSTYQLKASSNYQLKVVDDTTSKPVTGATVTFNGASSTTSADGTASFSTTASTSGTAAVTITKDGYAKQTVRLYELNPYSMNTINLSSESNPVSMALADIYLNGDEIKGPTVSILGKTFPLFSFKGSLNIPLSDITKLNASTENDTKNKTVKYILGVKPGYSLDTDAKRNEDYKNFKDFYKLAVGGSNQQAYDKYNSLRSKLKDGSGSLGFSCGIQFAGYLEFSYATGNMVLKEGGIIVTAEASVSTDVPFAGICYATFKIGGEIQGKLAVSQTSSGVLGASASIGLSVKPTVGVGIKVIMKDLASVEAGIDGKINGTVKIPASSFKSAFSAYLSAQCYVKAKALWVFEHKWSTNFPKLELYPNFGLTSDSAGEITLDSNGSIVSIDDGDFELIDRSYLGASFDSVTGGDDLNDSSVYPYGYPQLIKLDDGRVVAMFIYDDGSKSDINRTTLYYSIYDNSTWSKPTPVNNSGLADFPAKVCTDGENVYALWLRASEVLQDSCTTDDIVDKTELVYSSFNGSQWSEPVTVDTAGKYQMLYSIAENNGKTAIAWAENSDNNYTLNEGTTTLYTKTLENGEWSDEQTVTSAEGIASVAVGLFGSEVNVMYSVDNDGDLTTSGDSELYLNGTKLTDNDVDEGEVTFQNNRFYWIQGTELICYDGMTTSGTGLDVESDYRVLTNGSKTAVTYLASDGFKNELMVSYFNSGSYTAPVALTSYDRHISYYDALLNDDGSVSLLADIDNLSGDAEAYPYTTTDMVCDIISAKTDLEISDVRYDCAPTIGGEVSFTGTVTNTGMTAVDSYSLSFKNSSGAALRTETVYEAIQPGESKDFSVSYIVPSDFTKTTVTSQVNAEGDCVSANNAEAFTIGKADVEIIGAQISDGGVITATVINNGFETAENVSVKVSALGDTDTTLTTLDVGTLNAGETKDITYTVGSSYLDFTSYYVVNKFKLEASTSTQEESNGNNDAEVIYAPTPVESISLNTSTLKLEHGDSAQLVATVYPSDAYDKSVHWISDSIDVATVDENGNITTVGAGTAIITAITDDGGFVAQCEVTVCVRATGIDISKSDVTLNVGNTLTLTADVKPSGASDKNVTWTSSDASVATVSDDGVVKAIKSGQTTITVKTDDGDFEANCTVTVINKVTGITISDVSASLYVGKTKQLTAAVTPADADNTQIIWSSDNEDVAQVSENGLVTAVDSGTATITAVSVDGNYKASCVITVGKHVSTLLLSDDELSIPVGFTQQITVTVLPLSALNKNVELISTNPKVATIDENGTVTAIKAGSATIIACTEDGEITAECKVTVTNSVGGFSLSESEIYVARNSTKQLNGVFSPSTAENKNVTWESSNPTIATVDQNGLVTGKMAGTAVIVATTEDGGFKDYCSVKVVGLEAVSTANIDFDSGIITGLAANLTSLDGYIELSDSSCELKYDSLATDSIVYLTRNDEIIDAYTVVLFGDVNGDGWYDGMDAVTVSCIANGMLTKDQIGEAAYMAADCNHDGVVDEFDVALLNQAGVLLANVDQTKSSDELLETSSAYTEYINLIDQNPSQEELTYEPTETQMTVAEKIFMFIKSFFKIFMSCIPKTIRNGFTIISGSIRILTF